MQCNLTMCECIASWAKSRLMRLRSSAEMLVELGGGDELLVRPLHSHRCTVESVQTVVDPRQATRPTINSASQLGLLLSLPSSR